MSTCRDEHMGKTLTYIILTEMVLVTTDLSVFLPFVFLKTKVCSEYNDVVQMLATRGE